MTATTEKFQGRLWQREWELSLILAHTLAADAACLTMENIEEEKMQMLMKERLLGHPARR